MLLQKHHILQWVGQPSPFCVGIGLKWVEHSGTRGTDSAETYCAMTGWWFGTMELYDFPYIGKNNPYFSIFFHIFPYFSIYLEHVSIFWNWRTPSFFRGVGQPPSRKYVPWDFPTAAQPQWWGNVAVWSAVPSKTHLTLVSLVHVGSMFFLESSTGWWFGTMELYDFPSSQVTFTPWFFRGVGQPPTKLNFMKSQWPFTTSPTVRRSMALSRALPLSLCHTSIWSLGTEVQQVGYGWMLWFAQCIQEDRYFMYSCGWKLRNTQNRLDILIYFACGHSEAIYSESISV